MAPAQTGLKWYGEGEPFIDVCVNNYRLIDRLTDVCIHTCIHDDDVYPRETPPHIRTARASPQWHTAAGTAAPTTADTGNTVPQRANPTQTAYAHPRRRAQAQGQRLGTWTLVRPQKEADARIVPNGTTARLAPPVAPGPL